MNKIFVLSIILVVILAIVKTIIHTRLDLRNGYRIDGSGMKAYEYILPYDKQVSHEDEQLKRMCNILNRMLIISLIVFITIFIARYFFR